MANSSSVNSEAESRGSSQLNVTGACAYRLVTVEDLALLTNRFRSALLNMIEYVQGKEMNIYKIKGQKTPEKISKST